MKYILSLGIVMWSILLSAQQNKDILITYSKSEASLEEIFADLELQYGVRFSYATSSIGHRIMDANFDNASIEDVIDYLLEGQDMEFKIVDNNILMRKSEEYAAVESEDYKSSIHLKGKIVNKYNEDEVMDYATISVSNSSIGTYSNDKGHFDIEIPSEYKGERIIISYLGYADEVYQLSELEDEFLFISMENEVFSFEEIMIVNTDKPLRIDNNKNAIQLNKNQINSSTSGVMGNDIGRQIQLLPGITAHDDNSAAIKIRGSNSDETLMMLDGMPIYNASHYYGIFSAINTEYIDSVSIYKNTYPLEYGGRTGGLVELFSDNSHSEHTSANVNLDLLTASGSMTIPLSQKSQISIVGRSTIREINNEQFNTVNTQNLLNSQIESFNQKIDNRKNDPSFTFYDINSKFQYQNESNYFSVNFFRSEDDVKNDYKISIQDLNENEIKLIAIDDQSWSNTAGSLQWTKRLSTNMNWSSSAYFTHYSNEHINDFKLDKKYKPGLPPPPENNPLTAQLGAQQTNEVKDVGFDSHLEYSNKKYTLKAGFSGIQHSIEYLFRENNKFKIGGGVRFSEIASYAGMGWKFWNKFSINSGLRATYFTNLKEYRLSPRVLLNYDINQNIAFKTSYHIENQVIRQFYFEYRGEPMELWVAAGQNGIPVLRSQNIMVGATMKGKILSLDIELFRKDMSGVLEYLIPNLGEASNNMDQNRDYTLFRGNGLSRGIDFILSSGYKSYDTYLSYTWSKSEEQYNAIFKNQFFASENDRTHQFKWVNTVDINNFTLGLNGIYVSGRPYTDVRNVEQNEDIRDLNPESRLKRVKAYHRLDISGGYNFKIGGLNASITASIFNVFNTKNVQYIQSVATQLTANQNTVNVIVGNESALLNRTVNLGIKVGF